MDAAPPAQVLIPAATLVVFRHGADHGPPELLMVQRSRDLRFAGGMAVFPGGRVEPGDVALAAELAPSPQALDETAWRIAAVRETLEETGLLIGLERPVTADEARAARALLAAEGAFGPVLARFGWRLALDGLVPFAHWRQRRARAFDTRFYLADIGSGQVELAVDRTENARLFWTSAREALEMNARGEIAVIFPTHRNLERLAQFGNFAEAVAQARAIPPRVIQLYEEARNGEPHLCIPEGHGYPVTGQPLAQARYGDPGRPNP